MNILHPNKDAVNKIGGCVPKKSVCPLGRTHVKNVGFRRFPTRKSAESMHPLSTKR